MIKHILILAVAGLVLLVTFGGPNEAQKESKYIVKALGKCQDVVKVNALLKKLPPSTKAWGAGADNNGSEYTFSWGKGTLSNPLVSASCTTNKLTGKITYLTINGETIIWLKGG